MRYDLAAVRDSKNPGGPALPIAGFGAFIGLVKNGAYTITSV